MRTHHIYQLSIINYQLSIVNCQLKDYPCNLCVVCELA